jgi:hypothetical protein
MKTNSALFFIVIIITLNCSNSHKGMVNYHTISRFDSHDSSVGVLDDSIEIDELSINKWAAFKRLNIEPNAKNIVLNTCGYMKLIRKNVWTLISEKKTIESNLKKRMENFNKSYIEKESPIFKQFMMDQEKKFLSLQLDLVDSLNGILNIYFEKLNSLFLINCPGTNEQINYEVIKRGSDKLILLIVSRFTELNITPDPKKDCEDNELQNES